jgi:hypothetical protein
VNLSRILPRDEVLVLILTREARDEVLVLILTREARLEALPIIKTRTATNIKGAGDLKHSITSLGGG